MTTKEKKQAPFTDDRGPTPAAMGLDVRPAAGEKTRCNPQWNGAKGQWELDEFEIKIGVSK